MNENKRFSYHIDEVGIYYYVCDNTKKSDDRIILEVSTKYDAIEVCNVLNELNDESEQLKSDLNDLCEERNYFERKKCEYWIKFNHTHLDNIKLRKENEQLKKEMEKLKAQLLYTDSVCDICANHSLVQKEEHYISKCEKGYEECSKIILVIGTLLGVFCVIGQIVLILLKLKVI